MNIFFNRQNGTLSDVNVVSPTEVKELKEEGFEADSLLNRAVFQPFNA